MKEQKKRKPSELSSANSACCPAGDAVSVCGGVQPLSLAVRPSGTSHVDAANGQLKNSHPLNVRKNFFPRRLYLGRCTRAHATRCLASHLPSYLNSSSAPLHSASPSHNPPFAPSNYNSINQSFAVTMATAMLGTGPRVACGHQPAIDHHHLLHQNKANLSHLKKRKT